jgi:hypothetical protein
VGFGELDIAFASEGGRTGDNNCGSRFSSSGEGSVGDNNVGNFMLGCWDSTFGDFATDLLSSEGGNSFCFFAGLEPSSA